MKLILVFAMMLSGSVYAQKKPSKPLKPAVAASGSTEVRKCPEGYNLKTVGNPPRVTCVGFGKHWGEETSPIDK